MFFGQPRRHRQAAVDERSVRCRPSMTSSLKSEAHDTAGDAFDFFPPWALPFQSTQASSYSKWRMSRRRTHQCHSRPALSSQPHVPANRAREAQLRFSLILPVCSLHQCVNCCTIRHFTMWCTISFTNAVPQSKRDSYLLASHSLPKATLLQKTAFRNGREEQSVSAQSW